MQILKKKIKIKLSNSKYCLKLDNKKYKNMDAIETVKILKDCNIKTFISYIHFIDNNQYSKSVLFALNNGYEPYGIAINKFLKNK